MLHKDVITSTEDPLFISVIAPCPPPFRLRWNARESTWVKQGQAIASCEHGGKSVRVISPSTGRLTARRYRNNAFVVESDSKNITIGDRTSVLVTGVTEIMKE